MEHTVVEGVLELAIKTADAGWAMKLVRIRVILRRDVGFVEIVFVLSKKISFEVVLLYSLE